MNFRWNVVALFLSVTHGLAPPHPDYEGWESVHTFRERHNISYAYRPRHINDEHCRHLSESACEREDSLAGTAIAERRVAINTGTIKVLVILCRFKDHIDHDLPSREYFDELFNGKRSSVNEVGSIREWLVFASMGKYKVNFDVQDWHTVPFTEAEFAAGKAGLRGAEEVQQLFAEKLSDLYVSGYDFFDLDTEGWGTLDGLAAIHSGYGSEFGNNFDCANHNSNRTWSQGFHFTGASGWDSPDYAFTVSHFMVAGAWNPPVCSGEPAGMAVITHEYMHQFGLLDLYDNDKDEKSISIGGMGRFCLMSSVYGWEKNLAIPGHLSAYSRALTGWIEPYEILVDGYYPIQAAEFSSQVYVIREGFPDGEYLLIENRQPLKWDKDWPGGGIVIYHIDEAADRQSKRGEFERQPLWPILTLHLGYPGHPNFPEHHYRAAVLAADGEYSIEKGSSPGDTGDLWTKNMMLSADPDVWPNSASYQGGVVRATGIEITIRNNPAFIMSFEVSGLGKGATPRDSIILVAEDSETTDNILFWMMTMLGGVAAMLGIVVVVM